MDLYLNGSAKNKIGEVTVSNLHIEGRADLHFTITRLDLFDINDAVIEPVVIEGDIQAWNLRTK